jgi:hypothetical protein
MWQPAALIGRVGWGAARSQRRPGRRPAAQHPGARPVPSRRTRVRGGHAPSVFPSHASGRRRPPATPLRRQRPGPAGPGRPADGGVRGTYCVPRRLAAGRRSGAADHRGVRDPAGPRPPLRWTGRGSAARSRTTGLADCRPFQKRTERPETAGPCPPRQECRCLPSRRGNPASDPGHPGHAIGVRSARTASNRPGKALDSRPPAGTGSLVRPDHLTHQGVGTR